MGLGAILVLIAAVTGYSGGAQPCVYKIHFYADGLIAFGGPNRGTWLYDEVRKLSVHVIHPGRRLSPMALVHFVILLGGCVLMMFRNGQGVTTSYDYLFGGGQVMVTLRDTAGQDFHILRYSKLKQLGAVVSHSIGEASVSSQAA